MTQKNEQKEENMLEKMTKDVAEEGLAQTKALLILLDGKYMWNDRNELVYNSYPIPESDIFQLLKHASMLKSDFYPVGILQFYDILSDRIPSELVRSEKGRELMEKNQRGSMEERDDNDDQKGQDVNSQPSAKKIKTQQETGTEDTPAKKIKTQQETNTEDIKKNPHKHVKKWLTINEEL